MTAIDRVKEDRTAARRARDGERVTALGGLLAALEEASKAAGGTLRADDEIAVLRRERKRRAEAAASFREGGREESALREEAEAELIARYLPAELRADELESLVATAVAETGASSPRDMGAVIKLVMARAGGRADGRSVSAAVRERLGS